MNSENDIHLVTHDCWHLFIICSENKDSFSLSLRKANIGTFPDGLPYKIFAWLFPPPTSCKIIDLDLASQLTSLSHQNNVASMCLYYRYCHGDCFDERSSFVGSLNVFKHRTILTAKAHQFTEEIARANIKCYANILFFSIRACRNRFRFLGFQ